jgi:hypothetical protein
MSDDWRVELEIEAEDLRGRVRESLRDHRLAGEARKRLGTEATISADHGHLFAYAADEAGARGAAAVLAELASGHGIQAAVTTMRWHPVEEAWRPPDVPLPQTAEEHAAEHARLQEREARDSARVGFAEWEVRTVLPSETAAHELAQRLRAQGLEPLLHKDVVLVGAANEDQAAELALRVRAQTGPNADVVAQGSEGYAWAKLHPLGRLGGLAN